MYLELAQPSIFGPLIKEPSWPLIKAPFKPLTAEKFFDRKKLTFLTAEKITFKANCNVKTIRPYILNLEQKFSSLAFFAVDIKEDLTQILNL